MPLQALARGRSAQNITYADLSLLVSLILSLNLYIMQQVAIKISIKDTEIIITIYNN